MVNNLYPVKLDIVQLKPALAAWTMECYKAEPALEELVDRLEKVAVVAMARGPDGKSASLLTWHQRLAFKTMVTSAWKGVCGMEVVDLPAKIPGLDAGVAYNSGERGKPPAQG